MGKARKLTMNKNNTAQKCNTYHHGNLHDALIIAAAELIEENGSLDFTMIDAARRAGVSSAAPYRHFKDRDALLNAVANVAFMALSQAMESAAKSFPSGSAQCIIGLGKEYVSFVVGHPQYYDLMWGKSGDPARKFEPDNLKASAFHVLSEAVQNWCDAIGAVDQDPADLATKLWAMSHGLSGLALASHLDRFLPNADVYSMLESTTHTFLDGLKNGAKH